MKTFCFLMSSPPLGSISLTFMLDQSISLSFPLSVSYFLSPSCTLLLFSTALQSAFPLLSMNFVHSLLLPLQLQLSDADVHTDACKHSQFAHTHTLCTCTAIKAVLSAVSQSAVCKKTKRKTVVRSYSALHKGLVCQANQAGAAAYLNGFGRWQWELHLHTVPQINNRLLSGPDEEEEMLCLQLPAFKST